MKKTIVAILCLTLSLKAAVGQSLEMAHTYPQNEGFEIVEHSQAQ